MAQASASVKNKGKYTAYSSIKKKLRLLNECKKNSNRIECYGIGNPKLLDFNLFALIWQDQFIT